MTTVLVTGASGSVGRHVVDALLEDDFNVIAGCRRTSSMPLPLTENASQVTVRAFDFLDQGTWDAAVDGVDHVFLMRPPAIAAVEASINPFIRFARTRGVDHFVFLSVAGAGENKVVPHRKVEDFLRSEGAHHTNLRPGFFAQNLETAYGDDIRDDDRIYVPAGRKQPVNWIDTRDIADVVAKVLRNPLAHRGLNYTLAGPGPVRWEEVVAPPSAECCSDPFATKRPLSWAICGISRDVVGFPLARWWCKRCCTSSFALGKGPPRIPPWKDCSVDPVAVCIAILRTTQPTGRQASRLRKRGPQLRESA